MKKLKQLIYPLTLALLLTACAESSDSTTESSTGNSGTSTTTTTTETNKDSTPETADAPSDENQDEDSSDSTEEAIETQEESTEEETQETQDSYDDDVMRLSFQTTSLDGQTVTSDIFKDYDLTMINIWATWCGPCVNEMPDLQLVNEALPDNVNFITLCSDGATQSALANQILTASNATFQTIIPDDALDAQLMQYIMAFPTTIFVDKTGALTGGVIEGAPYDVVTSYLDAVDQVLAIQ